ncbi:MAG: V-type ATP synthase subunit D [Candidatus Thermoplasmatota archaeon]
MTTEYKPTRSTLLLIKKKIRLSETGYKLLRMKRDGLIMEFFKILGRSKDIRSRMIKEYMTAKQKIAIATCVDGAAGVRSAAFALSQHPTFRLKSRNVMGILVPEIEHEDVRKGLLERGYGILGTSARIDEAADAYEKLVEDIILAAEYETKMRKLIEEIDKTKRRVNALEFKVIPELQRAEAFIRLRLEELERENIFRLKRFKG